MSTALLTASLAQISFMTSVNSALSCLDRVFTWEQSSTRSHFSPVLAQNPLQDTTLQQGTFN